MSVLWQGVIIHYSIGMCEFGARYPLTPQLLLIDEIDHLFFHLFPSLFPFIPNFYPPSPDTPEKRCTHIIEAAFMTLYYFPYLPLSISTGRVSFELSEAKWAPFPLYFANMTIDLSSLHFSSSCSSSHGFTADGSYVRHRSAPPSASRSLFMLARPSLTYRWILETSPIDRKLHICSKGSSGTEIAFHSRRVLFSSCRKFQEKFFCSHAWTFCSISSPSGGIHLRP